ncbi:hypothetical protein JTZ10_22430 [Gordonia rubripertincta]|uniref:Insoluble domain protein n=1 Tax=Gordonia rubripertincta TaxID=36822 RepID=A0AAW4GA18_GORRU|nr:hypothetical protein [Gordonia rubripertincta]MBM7280508.1 hypothetical protein [Gordonia rubripertincta]QMU23519.1 hypothetical protein H3V45_23700 [Gordonia rubripertincta]
MYITSPAVTSPRFDTPPRRSRAQRRHRNAPPAAPFVGTVLAALMVSGSFGATLLVDSPAAAYEQGGVDQGETDDGFEQGGVGGSGDDATPPVAPPQQTAPSYNYNPGPGAIPAPPREAPYQPYQSPNYNQPNYDTVYNPAPPRAYTLPRPVAPVRPIAPPPKTLRVGNFLVEEDQLKRDAPWLTDRQRVSINEWSAYGEAKIAQGLISVGVPEDEASRQAAATIIGVALGGTAGAVTLGVPAAVTGGVGGALIGTGVGAFIGSTMVVPFPGANTGPGAAIGAAAGAAIGAAALGIPAAVVGGVAGGTAGGLLAHALGAGDPGANPRQPGLPGQPDPNRRAPSPQRPEPAPLPNPGANQFELHLPADQATKAGLPAVHYQVNVGGDVNAETTIGGQTYTANWTAEQAEAPYKALGGAADQVRKTVTDAAVDLSRQAEKAVPGLKVTFPQLTPKGA